MSTYEKNRAQFPVEELQRYAGQWVAFSMDGSRILASADSLPDLEERLDAAGEDPQQVALERIEFEDSLPGGIAGVEA
jgi:hypothetical protein